MLVFVTATVRYTKNSIGANTLGYNNLWLVCSRNKTKIRNIIQFMNCNIWVLMVVKVVLKSLKTWLRN